MLPKNITVERALFARPATHFGTLNDSVGWPHCCDETRLGNTTCFLRFTPKTYKHPSRINSYLERSNKKLVPSTTWEVIEFFLLHITRNVRAANYES